MTQDEKTPGYRITRVVTRKGDDGTTGLVGNRRVLKDSQRLHAYGTVDELNAILGMVRGCLFPPDHDLSAKYPQPPPESGGGLEGGQAQGPTPTSSSNLPAEPYKILDSTVEQIQNLLFILGGDLATLYEDRWDGMPQINEEHLILLDELIDRFNRDLPPLKEFVLPGPPYVSSLLHLARTVCRRAERETLTLEHSEQIGTVVLPFLNRLSDLLFVLARWICISTGYPESVWKR
jgi:cob(I)alamin adenosyltransferase